MLKPLLAFTLALFTVSATAQTFLVQEDFSSGIPSNWMVLDEDGHPLHSSMSQFTNAWISYETSSDTSAASCSYFDDTLQAQDYLILPKQSLLTFSKFSWEARSVDASYPDSYYVLLSTTDSIITSFTDTLAIVLGENPQWIRRSVLLDTMGFANQDVFIAFQNFTQDGFILEIDDVWLEVSDFASVEEMEEFSFNVYPNPATNAIKVECADPFVVQITNSLGQLIIQTDESFIDLSDLAPGNYYITLTSENGSSTQPLVKL